MVEKITATFIIQIAGKPMENVQKALEVVLKKLKEEKTNFRVLNSEIIEPELEEETTLFSGFLDVRLKFDTVSKLLDFIVDYTPSSVEVEEPEKIIMTNNEFTNILNEISSLILKSSSEVRNLRAYAHTLNQKILELENKNK